MHFFLSMYYGFVYGFFFFFFFFGESVMIAKSTHHYKFTNYVLEFGLFVKKLIIIRLQL